jgi:hypothetical protein
MPEMILMVSGVSWAKDHHSCVSAPSETTLVWFYYYILAQNANLTYLLPLWLYSPDNSVAL